LIILIILNLGFCEKLSKEAFAPRLAASASFLLYFNGKIFSGDVL